MSSHRSPKYEYRNITFNFNNLHSIIFNPCMYSTILYHNNRNYIINISGIITKFDDELGNEEKEPDIGNLKSQKVEKRKFYLIWM